MSHRREQKEAMRRERLEKQQAAARAAERKRLVGRVAAVALGIAAVAAIVVALVAGGDESGPEGGTEETAAGISVSYPDDPPKLPPPREFDLKAAAEAARCNLVDPPNEGGDHVETTVTYRANPPTSGSHNPLPAEDGAYESPPDIERAVHALEHGRIHIQFKEALAQPAVDRLYAVFAEDSYHMLISPNATKMPFEVAATTWDHALTCQKYTPEAVDAIRAFREEYRDKGPEFVP